jgi:hypothetical protein
MEKKLFILALSREQWMGGCTVNIIADLLVLAIHSLFMSSACDLGWEF